MKFNQKIAKHLTGIGLSAAPALAGAGTVDMPKGFVTKISFWKEL